MREQFEKLPEIKEMLLNNDELKWCYETNRYINHRVFQDAETGYINGAWYAFQEQQEKIARLQSALGELKEWCRFQLCENDGTQWDAGWCASHRRILNEINRITGADK